MESRECVPGVMLLLVEMTTCMYVLIHACAVVYSGGMAMLLISGAAAELMWWSDE